MKLYQHIVEITILSTEKSIFDKDGDCIIETYVSDGRVISTEYKSTKVKELKLE